MRPAAPLAILVALALLLGGCGGSGGGTTDRSVTESPAPTTRSVRAGWEREPGCERPGGASRWGCSVGPYRCQAVVVDRGWSVSCARPGESVAFLVRP